MTREEQLDWLCRLRSEIYVYMPKEWIISMNNALDMSIKDLEQEPCEDAISRKRVMAEYCMREGVSKKSFVDIINELPSVNPQEPKTGHWITKDGKEQGYDIGGIKTWYIQIMCDKCGFIKTAIEGHTGQYKYCPNCGARMESEVRNE